MYYTKFFSRWHGQGYTGQVKAKEKPSDIALSNQHVPFGMDWFQGCFGTLEAFMETYMLFISLKVLVRTNYGGHIIINNSCMAIKI